MVRHEGLLGRWNVRFGIGLRRVQTKMGESGDIGVGVIIQAPPDWDKLVRLCRRTIRRWESEAVDIMWMGQILDKVYGEVCTLTGLPC